MNDPRRPGRFSPPQPGSEPTDPQGRWYPPPVDPAYADQAPFAPTYGGPIPPWAPGPNEANPTTRLPAYWQYDQPPPGEAPPDGVPPTPPERPKTPRWLWIAAGVAVLLVVALVVALVLVNGTIRTQTAVPPMPSMPEPSTWVPTPSTTPPTRTSRSPIPVPLPPPLGPETPSETTTGPPAAMQDVVYDVTGEGRALSIMYVATGGLIQTEFNVALPWSKQVSLAKSATRPANVTIVNFGHDVACTVTVGGVQVSHRVGMGLTICDSRG